MIIEHQRPKTTYSPPSLQVPALYLAASSSTYILGRDLDAPTLSREVFSVFKTQPIIDWLAEFPLQSAQELSSPKYTSSQDQISLDQPTTSLRRAVANKLGRKQSPFFPYYLYHICHNPQKRASGTYPGSNYSSVQNRHVKENKKNHLHSSHTFHQVLCIMYSTEPHSRQMK